MTDLPALNLKYETNQLAGSASREQKDYNWGQLNQYGSQLSTWLQGVIDGYDLRFNNMISNSENVNEVVDARIDLNNTTYRTLKARLDAEQEATPQILDTGNISDANSVLLIKDLSSAASTSTIYYANSAQLADISLPAMGYSECSASKISYAVLSTISS